MPWRELLLRLAHLYSQRKYGTDCNTAFLYAALQSFVWQRKHITYCELPHESTAEYNFPIFISSNYNYFPSDNNFFRVKRNTLNYAGSSTLKWYAVNSNNKLYQSQGFSNVAQKCACNNVISRLQLALDTVPYISVALRHQPNKYIVIARKRNRTNNAVERILYCIIRLIKR